MTIEVLVEDTNLITLNLDDLKFHRPILRLEFFPLFIIIHPNLSLNALISKVYSVCFSPLDSGLETMSLECCSRCDNCWYESVINPSGQYLPLVESRSVDVIQHS